MIARIVEPTSKADAARVLTDLSADTFSYRTIQRRLVKVNTGQYRDAIAQMCFTARQPGRVGDREWVKWFNTERPRELLDDFTPPKSSRSSIAITDAPHQRQGVHKNGLRSHRDGSKCASSLAYQVSGAYLSRDVRRHTIGA